MNDNIKVGLGFLIPASAIILFIASIYTENFLLGAFISILGLLGWFLYSAIMQTSMPNVTGNIILFFGFLLSLAIFLSYGMRRNMFGGYEFVPEGVAGSAILLLIIVLLGILFKKHTTNSILNAGPPSNVSFNRSAVETPTVTQPQKSEKLIPVNRYDSEEAERIQEHGNYEEYWDPDDYEEYWDPNDDDDE